MKIGIVASPLDDSDQLPSQLVSYQGKEGRAVPFYPYGLHGVAEDESYVLVITVNGNSEERICIPTSMLKRPKLEVGEVSLYHPPTGAKITLKTNGDVNIDAVGDVNVNSPGLMRIVAPDVEIEGNLDVSGNVGIGGDSELTGNLTVLGETQLSDEVMSGSIYIGSRHKHQVTGTGTYSGFSLDNP
jgi:phage gp45-like